MKKVDLGKYRYIDRLEGYKYKFNLERKMHGTFIVNYVKQHFYLWWAYA